MQQQYHRQDFSPQQESSLVDLEQFRTQTRAWLEANCPESQRQPMTPDQQYWGGRGVEFPSEDAKLWFEKMRDHGWIAPEWPKEYGGGSHTFAEGKVIKEEMKRINARNPIVSIGIWMLGPALLEYGTEAQKQQHVRAISNGEIRWCQAYSELVSGSGLACVQTPA